MVNNATYSTTLVHLTLPYSDETIYIIYKNASIFYFCSTIYNNIFSSSSFFPQLTTNTPGILYNFIIHLLLVRNHILHDFIEYLLHYNYFLRLLQLNTVQYNS